MRFVQLFLMMWAGFTLVQWSIGIDPTSMKSNALLFGLFLMIWGLAHFLDGEKK